MKKNQLLMAFAAITLLYASCKKDDAPAIIIPEVTKGFYVLSEGGFGFNNTALTYYDFTTNTPVTDFYRNVNGSGLGDTGNDMIIYGGKMYIVMNVSSYVAVANAFTGKRIDSIDFKTAGVARQPRYAAAYKNKIYVSSYDGTVAIIDTTTLKIEKSIPVGTNPEKLAIAGNNLYVTNSGWGADSTVSVIDLTTNAEVKKVTVGLNPFDVAVNSAGDVYVTTRGLWNNASYKPQIHVIDSKSNTVKASLPNNISSAAIRIFNDTAYLYGGYAPTPNIISLLNTKTNTLIKAEFVTDGTTVESAYGLNINPDNGDVYLTDAKDYLSAGSVFCFDRTGKKKFSFSVTPGISPNKVVFIKQ